MTSSPPIFAALREITDTVSIQTDESFIVAGEEIAVDCLNPRAKDSSAYLECPLSHDLRQALYRRFYARFDRIPNSSGKDPNPAGPDTNDHLGALRTANGTADSWDQGWKILAINPTGTITAAKAAKVGQFAAGRYVHRHRSAGGRPGDLVDVRIHRDSTSLQPGFYFAFSETLPAQSGSGPTVRFYWNASPAAAISLVDQISTRLNRYAIPYEMKCPPRTGQYGRVDSLVLYLRPQYVRSAFPLLAEIHRTVASELRDAVPLFTHRLGTGLALAESPNGKLSFGQHRCGLIATGLVAAYRKQLPDCSARLTRIIEQFQENGISLERPWLTDGSADPFGLATLKL
jgi:hypothetical protein